MISKKLCKWCSCAVLAFAAYSCTENIDTSARYVFTDDTIISYLERHDSTYHTYTELLKKVKVSPVSETTVAQLLSARGSYTCFVPTEEAIQIYLDSLAAWEIINEPSWDGFPNERVLDSIEKVIVYNSIIDGGDAIENYFQTVDFPVADKDEAVEFELPNLNDRKLNVRRDKTTDTYLINENRIDPVQCDILVTNGVMHQMKTVLAPRDQSAGNFFNEIVNQWKDAGRYDVGSNYGQLVLARVLQACNLLDTLSVVRDDVYETKYLRGEVPDLIGMTKVGFAEGNIGYAPQHRNIGFTIFAEGDQFWMNEGLDPTDPDLLQKLTQWILDNHQYSVDDVFTTDNKYASEKHLLYQWITYHMLPMRIPTDKLVIHDNELGYTPTQPKNYTIPVYEYYTTMGPRRLIKIFESRESKGVYLNRFPVLNNGRDGDNHELSCDEEKTGCLILKDSANLDAMRNCIIYPIDKPLSYSDFNRDQLAKERLRFDGMSLFPEAMTNDIRRNKQGSGSERYEHVHIPESRVYPYFENMTIAEGTIFVYYNTYSNWCNLYEDEMKAVGRFEITVKLPPVPRQGTYELRYCVLANGNRGVVQPYFGYDLNNLPVTGIPMDLTLDARNSADAQYIGYLNDTGDPDYDAEIDRQMRNNGFMKGCKSVSDRSGGAERDWGHRENTRRLLTRLTMYPDKTYYLKLKSVLQSDRSEFYMDYLELCPKEIFDNPETPEDIW